MDNIISLFLAISIWQIGKWMVVLALLIYLVFAFVVVRQVAMMIKVVSGQANFIIGIVSWIHFFFAVLAVILALLIL